MVLESAKGDLFEIERQIDGTALDLDPPVHDRPRAARWIGP
jgi:hypothetical protein